MLLFNHEGARPRHPLASRTVICGGGRYSKSSWRVSGFHLVGIILVRQHRLDFFFLDSRYTVSHNTYTQLPRRALVAMQVEGAL